MILKHHITTKNLQSGRSMVEMLGTLAIIGVLSVGAIAGYSYGMNKYRANQTMHDISLRTVDLLTQASQGRAELTFAEWDKETTIYDFANPAYSDDGLIMFDVGTTKKIPQSVCQMVFEGLSNTAVQIDINDSVATSQDNCGNDNTMTFYFEGGGNGTGGETGEQCGDTVCGTCQKCDSATETCVTVSDYEQKCTTDDNKTGWCVGETCQAENCNCDENQYCADTNEDACAPHLSGLCYNLNFFEYTFGGVTYYHSKGSTSWWNAASACQALGKKLGKSVSMITTSELVEKSDGSVWTGGDGNYVAKPLLGKMYNEAQENGVASFVLTRELYDSCSSYYVDLRNGEVSALSRHYYGTGVHHVVCR